MVTSSNPALVAVYIAKAKNDIVIGCTGSKGRKRLCIHNTDTDHRRLIENLRRLGCLRAPYPAWHSQQYLLKYGNMCFVFTIRPNGKRASSPRQSFYVLNSTSIGLFKVARRLFWENDTQVHVFGRL